MLYLSLLMNKTIITFQNTGTISINLDLHWNIVRYFTFLRHNLTKIFMYVANIKECLQGVLHIVVDHSLNHIHRNGFDQHFYEYSAASAKPGNPGRFCTHSKEILSTTKSIQYRQTQETKVKKQGLCPHYTAKEWRHWEIHWLKTCRKAIWKPFHARGRTTIPWQCLPKQAWPKTSSETTPSLYVQYCNFQVFTPKFFLWTLALCCSWQQTQGDSPPSVAGTNPHCMLSKSIPPEPSLLLSWTPRLI